MTKVTLSILGADSLDRPIHAGIGFALDQAGALAGLSAALGGEVRALQISAQLLRQEWSAAGESYEVRILAQRIGPISSVSDLPAALDRAFATGQVVRYDVLQGGETRLRIDFAVDGWLVTSGAQTFRLLGLGVDSLADLRGMMNLLLQAPDFAGQSAEDRRAWLQGLIDHGMTGIALDQNGGTVFGFETSGQAAWLRMGDFSLRLAGAPEGAAADLALRMMAVLEGLDTTGRLDLAPLAGLGIDALLIRDAAGRTLLRTGALTDTAPVFTLGGHRFGEWLSAGRDGGDDHLVGRAMGSLVFGHGGNDWLEGGGGNDALYGGAGSDRLNGGEGDDILRGGAGSDRAMYLGAGAVRVDLRATGAQDTGQGRDVLADIEEVTSGKGADWLHGSIGANRLEAGEGDDRVEGGYGADLLRGNGGADRLIGGPGADTLDGGYGSDLLTGGMAADVFVFRPGAGQGVDVITDFDPTLDRIALQAGAGLGAEQVMARFAHLVGDHVELQIGPGLTIVLEGLTSLEGLAAALDLV